MPLNVLQLARRHRDEISRADAANLQRLAEAYALMYEDLEGDIDALTLAIEEGMSAAEVKRLPQYKRLLRNGASGLDKFTNYLEVTIGTASAAAIGLGLTHSQTMISSMGVSGFKGLDSRAMKPLLDYLAQGSPLYRRLAELTGSTVDKVVQTIVDGVGVGYNPRKIADQIQNAFGAGLTDALRNTRTVQIYSYRDSARANYMATGGIVKGWIWYAELDADTCLSCVAQHGTIHDLDEQLDDHYNGRCAPLPYIEEFGNPVEQSGEDYFSGLTEAEQKASMGDTKWQAWQDGKFTFDQLSAQHENDVYGHMRSEASLASLLGEE